MIEKRRKRTQSCRCPTNCNHEHRNAAFFIKNMKENEGEQGIRNNYAITSTASQRLSLIAALLPSLSTFASSRYVGRNMAVKLPRHVTYTGESSRLVTDATKGSRKDEAPSCRLGCADCTRATGLLSTQSEISSTSGKRKKPPSLKVYLFLRSLQSRPYCASRCKRKPVRQPSKLRTEQCFCGSATPRGVSVRSTHESTAVVVSQRGLPPGVTIRQQRIACGGGTPEIDCM